MDQPRRLPARELPLPGESLDSLVRRVALAMGYERTGRIRVLLSAYEPLPAHFDQLSSGPALNGLAAMLGVDPHRLLACTIYGYAKRLAPAGGNQPPVSASNAKTLLRFFRPSLSPVCPRCLGDDPPFERLLWSFRPTPICTIHRRLLLEHCPSCQRGWTSARMDPRMCRCGFTTADAADEQLSEAAVSVSTKVQHWLVGSDRLWPETSRAAFFAWMERLASAALRTPAWIARMREQWALPPAGSDELAAWLAAAEMLDGWPDPLEEFLEEFQKVAKHRTTDTGVSRSFGLLLRDAVRLEEIGCSRPAEFLRDYLLQRYTRGHLNRKVCLFRGTTDRELASRRPWLTQTEATTHLGLRHGAVADLVQRGLLVGRIQSAGVRGRSVGLVSRDSVETLQRQLESALTVREAAKRLGVERHRIGEMLHAGLLGGAVRTARGWLIPRRSIEDFEHFLRSLPVIERRTTGWLTSREATRRFGPSGLTLVRLLELVSAKQVRGGRNPLHNNLCGLLAHADDLASMRCRLQQQQNESRGYTLNRLTKQLIPGRHLKDIVLRKWIRAGLLRAERKGATWFIGAGEVERFRTTYCLADEACELLGISRATLSRWEKADRITPVYGRRAAPAAGASVFLREDVKSIRCSAAK